MAFSSLHVGGSLYTEASSLPFVLLCRSEFACLQPLLRQGHRASRRSGFTTIRKLHPVLAMKDLPYHSCRANRSEFTCLQCFSHHSCRARKRSRFATLREIQYHSWFWGLLTNPDEALRHFQDIYDSPTTCIKKHACICVKKEHRFMPLKDSWDL